jgi:hypothetical protein
MPKTDQLAAKILNVLVALAVVLLFLAPLIFLMRQRSSLFSGQPAAPTGVSTTVTSISSADVIGLVAFLVTLVSVITATIGVLGYLYARQQFKTRTDEVDKRIDEREREIAQQFETRTDEVDKRIDEREREIKTNVDAWDKKLADALESMKEEGIKNAENLRVQTGETIGYTLRMVSFEYWRRFEEAWNNANGDLDVVRQDPFLERLLERAADGVRHAYKLYLTLPEETYAVDTLGAANDLGYYLATLKNPSDRDLTLGIADKLMNASPGSPSILETVSWILIRLNGPDDAQWKRGRKLYEEKVKPSLPESLKADITKRYDWAMRGSKPPRAH